MTAPKAPIDIGTIDPGLFCIVLAAGASRRFGSTKQLAAFRGHPLVTRAVRLAESVFGERTVLVAGHEWSGVSAASAPLAGFLVVNPDYSDGLGSSIAAGVAAVAGGASGVLLLLADQPLIEAAYLREMAGAWSLNPDRIIATEYNGIDGPPVIFPSDLFSTLISLRGDTGARQVLQANAARVLRLNCAAAAFDIDVPADLAVAES